MLEGESVCADDDNEADDEAVVAVDEVDGEETEGDWSVMGWRGSPRKT
jgi:hypothetical protein